MNRHQIDFALRAADSLPEGSTSHVAQHHRRLIPPLLPPLLPPPLRQNRGREVGGLASCRVSEVPQIFAVPADSKMIPGVTAAGDENNNTANRQETEEGGRASRNTGSPPLSDESTTETSPSSSSSLASLIPPTVHAATVGTSRNFIGLLNEAFQRRKVGGRFEFEEMEKSGPSHKPIFTYAVTVNEIKYSGTATTKQEAKQNAAWAALQGNRLLPNASNDGCSQTERAPKTLPKHPLCILNELFPGLEGFETKVVPVPVGTESYFRATLHFNESEFTGDVAKTKKGAKTLAANKVLFRLFGDDYAPESFDAGKVEEKLGVPQAHLEVPWLSLPPLCPHDVIARSVFEKFFEVIAPYPLFSKWKVIAGIAFTAPGGVCQVVSLASGTKCVSGEKISLQGQSVNDCHAEVLARRGFVRFLYGQLRRVMNGRESTLLRAAASGGYELRPDVEVHLVISTSPCGDGRIFAPFDRASSRTKGSLRVKVEAGMGTIPVRSFSSVQTWDGVMEGERLLTMSCSDKLCRRNVLGIQGSLLSQFMSPIYFKSIIIGSMCNIPHLQRALIDRLAQGLNRRKLRVPEPFRLNRPQILPTCYQAPREPGTKAPNHAVNWVVDEGVEIIDATTGRVLHTRIPSRLCKREFFQMWNELQKDRGASVCPLSVPIENGYHLPPNYQEAKNRAHVYAVTKRVATNALADGGCGRWVTKPQEGSNFFLHDGFESTGDDVLNRDGSAC